MKRNAMIKTITLGLLSSTMISGAAIAGGFDRGGVNIDQLFDKDRFSFSSRVTYVNPQRTIKNVTRAGIPVANVDNDGDYIVPRVGIKADVVDNVACLASYSEPFGGDANYGIGNAFSPSTVEFFLDTQDYGLTCSYQFGAGSTSVGDAYARIIVGGSYMELEGFLSRQAGFPATGLASFSISDETTAWRAGVAYEIPEIALTAQLVYNSAYDLNITGVQDTTALGGVITPITLPGAEMPQSLDFKFSTGISEDTLAFLNMRWQDWSQLQILPVTHAVTGAALGSTLDLSYRDGYTVTAGIGKKLSDKVSTLTSLTWDRGTSTIVGTQTDTWTLAAGVRYKQNKNLRFSVGGAIGILEGGLSTVNPANADPSSAVTYNFDADLVYALTAGLKYRF